MAASGLEERPDGTLACWWGDGYGDLSGYHDDEWGTPVTSDIRLYEKMCLEGFQSGLSWLTILRKRDNFREAFAGFDIDLEHSAPRCSDAAIAVRIGHCRAMDVTG